MSATPAQVEQRPAIILVDDYEDILTVFKQRIELSTPYRVLTATTGRQLFELLREHKRVAAILLDINLPGELGSRIAAEVKRERPGLPVALVTAYFPTEPIKADAKAAGVPLWDKLELSDVESLISHLRELTQSEQ